MKPSEFLSIQRLNTEARLEEQRREKQFGQSEIPRISELLDITQASYQRDSVIPIGRPLFDVFPPELSFQQYSPYQLYKIPLRLRNIDQVVRQVRVVCEASEYFTLVSPAVSSLTTPRDKSVREREEEETAPSGLRVAPGMEVVYTVEFRPDQQADYAHEVTILTEREKLKIPVRATGSRALLDFPDWVELGEAPVRHECSKTLLVRNLGKREGRFVLRCVPPQVFSATPMEASLEPQQCSQVTVKMQSTSAGSQEGVLSVLLDSGEELSVSLRGYTHNAAVRLERREVRLEDTYVGLGSRQEIKLINNSDVLVNFCWKALGSEAEEEAERDNATALLATRQTMAEELFRDESERDERIRDRVSILTRSFKMRQTQLTTDRFHFEDRAVSLDPLEGEVWPHTETLVSVRFHPTADEEHSSVAYCEVTGRESRLPLFVSGRGLGPRLELSLDQLNIGKVCLCTSHVYELLIRNTGYIPGEYSLLSPSDLGAIARSFHFSPSQGVLQPGDVQAVEINFSYPQEHPNKFLEEFEWAVTGANSLLKLSITGAVTKPTFTLSLDELNFGMLAYGFPVEQQVSITNTSSLQIECRLHVPQDGELTQEDVSVMGPCSSVKEFRITPDKCTIPSGLSRAVSVEFSPRSVRAYNVRMLLDIIGVSDAVCSIPILAQVRVPAIVPSTQLLNCGSCFVGHTFVREIQLINDDEYPALYILQEETDRCSHLLVSSTEEQGVVPGNGAVAVPLQLQVNSIGDNTSLVRILILGSEQLINLEVRYQGEGPVVHVTPTTINWGKLPVFVPNTFTVSMSNQAPIPADFACCLATESRVFTVDPDTGSIPPHNSQELRITANLNDSISFSNKLVIRFNHEVFYYVGLEARGRGVTVLASPPITPRMDFGHHYSSSVFKKTFTLTNNGTRTHILTWNVASHAAHRNKKLSNLRLDPLDMANSAKISASRAVAEVPPSVKLVPQEIYLPPGASSELSLEVYSETPRPVREVLLCYALIGKLTTKQLLLESEISVDFIQPLIRFSHTLLSFCCLQDFKGCVPSQSLSLSLLNVSSLPLTPLLSLPSPFSFHSERGLVSRLELDLDTQEQAEVSVYFDPDAREGRHSYRVQEEMLVRYTEHPSQDAFPLSASVHFPNLSFSSQEVDFGTILNNTETVHKITLHNTSPIEVQFSWCFQQSEQVLTPAHRPELDTTRVFSDSLDDNGLTVHSPTKPLFQPWGDGCDPFGVAPINQLFDILPIHGSLQPDESMQVEFSYYGGANNCVGTTAVCSVEQGPEYSLMLKGQASSMKYKLSRSVLDISHCHYAKEALLEVTLYNTGMVDFSFEVSETRWQPLPSQSATSSHFILAFDPDTCSLPAGSHKSISVRFTPGVPGPFRTEFFLHIAHFQPESVEIVGEAIFPNFRFSLPRPNIDRMLMRDSTRASSRLHSLSGHESPILGDSDEQETRIEQDVVRRFAISGSRITVDTLEATGSRQLRAVLPAYELDFGYVILGRVRTHTLSLYNPTNFTVSVSLFQPGLLKKSGFNFAGHKFTDIPPTGALELEVTFDPAAVGMPCGSFDIHSRFLVADGPEVPLVLKGEVTLPDLELSDVELNFEDVLVSRCKIVTLQLYNPTPVTCTWHAEVPLPPKKVNKFIPLHLKKKLQPPKHTPHFEVIPTSGIVEPGQRLNVKVKFTPSEQLKYARNLIFRLQDSPLSYHSVLARGSGVEQQLQFSTSVLEFGPVLPLSPGEVKEVTITNLTPFPCEIYSLEFDPVYLEEEDTLRALGDYDKFGQLMLPPREVGDKLPCEVIEWWEGKKPELEALKAPLQSPGPEESVFPQKKPNFVSTISNDLFQYENANYLERISPASVDFSSIPGLLESLKNSPNMAAVARHIGILPTESQRQLELGIVFVLNGGPYSGKSTQARLLSEKYYIPVLDLDSVLVEAVQQGVLPAAQKAREMCVQAGLSGREEENEASDQPETRDKLAKDKLEAVPQAPCLPPPLEFEIRDPTTEDAVQLSSTLLPEELVVEILTSRVHSNDCFPGMVLDSLACSFLADMAQTSRVLLRSIRHRELFYFVNLEFNPEAASEAKQHREEEEAAKEREMLLSLSPPLHPDFLDLELDLSDEEGYERLGEEQKAALLKSVVSKRRLAREKQRLEEEERRQEQELLEQKRQMEEEAKKKGSKKGQKAAANALKDGSSDNFKGLKPSPSGTSIAQQHQQHSPAPGPAPTSPTQSRPVSVSSDRTIKRAVKNAAIASKLMEIVPPAPEEDEMSVLFAKFDRNLLLARSVVELWDSEKMEAFSLPEPLLQEPLHDPAPSRQQRAKKDLKKDATLGLGDPVPGLETLLQSKPDNIGLPMYNINGISTQEYIHAQICGLPGVLSPVQLLDHLGIGPAGPKIPSPLELSLVNYPIHRQRPDPPDMERRFCFVATHPEDPNAIDPKVAEEELLMKQQPISPIQEEEKEIAPPPSRKSTQSRASQDSQRASKREVSGKKSHKKKSQKDPRSSTPKISSSLDDSPGPDEIIITPDVVVPVGPKKLIRHRWVIPGNGSIEIAAQFASKEVGNFDETLHFEVVGTLRRYQLYCRGLCAVPGVCADPKVVFPSCKPSRKPSEIVKKKFVLSQDMYDFGPLSYFRSRERRFQGKHPENMEELTILNDSPLHSIVTFKFKDDSSAHTFLLEPPSLTLNPGEKGKLSIWAYPKHPHEFLDTLMCCIENNPNPVSFKLRAICVKPELKLDRNDFKFDKVLLHRKENRQIFLKNMTLLPVSWKLATGERSITAETDADIYSFNQEQGIVEPQSEFPLVCYFRSPRPAVIKKTLRLEIYSLDSTIGLLTNENLTLHVEAYDVALDISFPKGSDGKLDFNPVRIYEETKQACHIKNKGKYELHFQFDFETINGVSMKECFEVNPIKGTLQAGEKAQPVTFVFNPKHAFTLNNIPAMRCHVIDPTYGEVIASIPIHVQAQAVFSEFKVHPVSDINFGPVVVHAPGKQQKTLTIENVGLFEFRYNIVKLSSFISRQRLPESGSRKAARTKEDAPQGRASAKTQIKGKTGPTEQRPEGPQAPVKQNMGSFTLNPTHAIVHPGQSQQVTIECHPENSGTFEEKLVIDVTDKNPNPHPVTKVVDVQYRLLCEACVPSIERNVASVFEEHRICKSFKSVSNGSLLLRGVGSGIFFEAEKIFRFNTIVVGRQAEARLRVQNTSKVPCDLLCINRSAAGSPSRQMKGIGEIFEIEPSKLHLHPHSHKFVTVTFRPQAIQQYHCQFAVSLEGPGHLSRGMGLNYELQGEGSLPQITVVQPAATDRSGKHVMIFKRLVVGRTHSLPLVLSNTGSMPALMNLKLDEEVEEFVVRAIELPKDVTSQELDLSASGANYPQHLVNLIPGDRCRFEVSFSPRKPGDHSRRIVLQVQDNPYENTQILLLAESYVDEIVIDNIRGAHVSPQLGVSLDSSLLKPINENHLDFGNCAVGEEKQLVFSVSNNSQEVCKLHFDSVPNSLVCSPTTAHLHPNCSKDILITFKSDKNINLKKTPILCKLQKIKLADKDSSDWDDRMKVTKWVPVHPGARHQEEDRMSVVSGPRSASHRGSTVQLSAPVPASPTVVKRKKITEVEKEPTYQELPNTSRQLELYVSGSVDLPRVECSVSRISLLDTMMFQSRKFKFELRNVNQVTAHFEWLLDSPLFPEPVPFDPDQPEGLENLYLSLTPSSGDILPQEHALINLKFSPSDVIQLEAKLIVRIRNLPPESSDIEIPLTGQSVMPYCHFELPTVSYSHLASTLDMKTSTASYSTPLNPSTRVLTFESCGVGVKVAKSFHVINPTNLTYEFLWKPDLKEDVRKPFLCQTKTGSISGGKKFEMTFEYLPSTVETEECLWRFTIPSLALTVPLLFVGYIAEPRVLLDRSYLHFKPQLVNQVCRESVFLINDEDRPYSFSVREASCHMPGHQASLNVSPMSGSIDPHTRLPIKITLPLKRQAEHSFNLKFDVKHNPEPLVLNVKASAYLTDASLKVRDMEGEEFEVPVDVIKQKSEMKQSNFGIVQLNEKSLNTLILCNNGLFAFDYFWELSDKCFKTGGSESEGGQLVNIKPQTGRLEPKTSCHAELSFCPAVPINLKGCSLVCHIKDGPTFSLGLLGKGIKPSLIFSFTKYNFGLCFLHHPALPPNTAVLTISNPEDTQAQISLDVLPFSCPHLSVNFTPIILNPGASTEAEITFMPQEPTKYSDAIEFNINGITKQLIELVGQGTELKLQVTKPPKKLVNFGVIRVNEKVDRSVTITNLSAANVEFGLQIKGPTPPDVLKMTPSENIKLKPNGDSVNVSLTFCPTSRLEQFTDEVQFEISRLVRPLFMISGCCQDVHITLATSHLPFGQVCLNSKSSRQLQLSNKGDIGAHFKWDVEAFKPNFTISPTQGYISPKMEIVFLIEFHPIEINNDVRYENIKCELEGTKPQYVTLTGMCTEITPRETIPFTTAVRTSESKQIPLNLTRITNTLNLKPTVEGDFWSGPELLVIEPNQTKNYTITYYPLEMTGDHKKHLGSVFFPLPDGQGLLYNFTGISEPPKPMESRAIEVPSKLKHTELLTVSNWLKTNQRFKVIRDILKPDRPDISLSIQGLDYIDVPGNSKREYQLQFHAFKVGTTYMRVTFRNEDTGEFCFYLLTFKAVSSGTIEVIKLDTTVRQRVIHTIAVHNPLPIQVSISTNCSLYDISLPAQFLVGAQSEGTCTFEYLPLKAGEVSGEITLTSSDLGLYHYSLQLTAVPRPPEPPVTLIGYLGSTTVQPVSFTSYAKANRVEYTCKVDHADFHVERTVLAASAAGGIEVQIDVQFEPSNIGTINANLTVSSQTGGEYLIPLVGECNLPNPQGPYVIKASHSVSIPFKNVFPVPVTYTYSLDNPAFQLRAVDQLKPKKSYTITVTFDPKQGDSYGTNTGKLIAKCPPGYGSSASSISWIFYLKGII